MTKENVYQLTEEEILQKYETDREQGLTQEEAEKRLEKYGGNIIDSGDKVSPWKILLDKVHNLIVYLLIGSIIISFIMGDVAEGIAIIIAVFIAVFFRFFYGASCTKIYGSPSKYDPYKSQSISKRRAEGN